MDNPHHRSVSSSRLRTAAFAPIGDEGRAELVETRLLRAISCGAFIAGERLPSESELSQLLGVAVVTVREALSSLRRSGLITTKRGRQGGSFVNENPRVVQEVNAQTLLAMPRVALADLAVHYEMVVATCAEYACKRATTDELEVARQVLADSFDLPNDSWRRRVTDLQLELASLSQSVRLTSEHVRIQAEFTPLLSLQDVDAAQRLATHDFLAAQIEATSQGDIRIAREIVQASIRSSLRWLTTLRADLLSNNDIHATLERLHRNSVAVEADGEAA